MRMKYNYGIELRRKEYNKVKFHFMTKWGEFDVLNFQKVDDIDNWHVVKK